MGRFPWRTLGLQTLRDSAGECLWYVVSGSHKQGTTPSPSSDVNGMLQVENAAGTVLAGATPESRALVALIAPGEPIDTQTRGSGSATPTECGAVGTAPINQAHNFLDNVQSISNSRGTKVGAGAGNPGSQSLPTAVPSVFAAVGGASSDPASPYNDRIDWIRPAEYDRWMNRWVARRAQQCLIAYGNSHAGLSDRFPWAAALDASLPIEFSDDSGDRFGRIPDGLTATVNSNPGMADVWPVDPLNSGATCFSWSWWPQWQNQVLYAVEASQAPSAGAASGLSVDGIGSNFVVIVSGRKLPSQSRGSFFDLGNAANYLEGDNIPALGAGTLPGGDENFTMLSTATNDTVCNVVRCQN